MKSPMIERFETALNSMSDAEFQAMWNEVMAEGEEGPSADRFIASFALTPAVLQASVQYTVGVMGAYANVGEYNFAMAA